jgi:large subunit ribosomal protein L5
MARLQEFYRSKVAADLQAKFGYKSVMEVPRITKITLNMGVSEAVGDLTKISGQKPVVTKTRKAIAGFKIRENYPIGCMVTLRGQRMYEFLDRLIAVALPRVRDFRGVSGRAFDGRGNYNIGVKEQIIFPEIEYDKIDAVRGMNISITTTAKTDEEAKALLSAFSFPFRN